MKIIFMGTAAFAIPILEVLAESRHEIVAVYTKPPKRQSRGMKLHKSPIHDLAETYNLTVVTSSTLRTQEALDELKQFDADVIVVAAYGLIIPQQVLDSCKYGCINVHPSDLPRWRGAAPIQRAMMACDKETAICIMQMDAGIDTGPVFMKKVIPLDQQKDIHQLTQEYAEIGAEMLLETLEKIEKGNAIATPQQEIGATYAHKIESEEMQIDWQNSAERINAQIKALTPDAYFLHNNIRIKVIESILIEENSQNMGTGMVLDKQLSIVCGDGKILQITRLQKPGGKKLSTKEFLCGYKITAGDIL